MGVSSGLAPKRIQSVFRSGVIVFAAQMAVNVFNYAFSMLLSRRLGVAAYGSLWTLITVVVLCSVPAVVMLNVASGFAAEAYALAHVERLESLKRSVLRYASAICGAGILFSAILARPTADYLRLDDAVSVFLAGVTISVVFLLYSFRGVMQGAHLFSYYAISTALESSIRLILGYALATGYGLRGALAGYAAGSIFSTVHAILKLRPTAGKLLHMDWRRLARSTGGTTMSIVALTMLGFSDSILVKHFFSETVAGEYSIVALGGKVVFFLVGFLPTLVLPRAAAAVAEGRSPRRVLGSACLIAGAISGIALLVFGLFPSQIAWLLGGAAFVGGAPYFFWYAFAMVLLGLLNIVASYRIALHRFSFAPYVMVVAVSELVAINIWHGSIGRIVAIVVAVNAVALACSLAGVAKPVSRNLRFSNGT